MERVIKPWERIYLNFEFVAMALEVDSINNWNYTVRDVYLDFGQDWVWTTICTDTHQVLDPREWKLIYNAETTAELMEVVEIIKSDRFFQDK